MAQGQENSGLQRLSFLVHRPLSYAPDQAALDGDGVLSLVSLKIGRYRKLQEKSGGGERAPRR
ncbi:hypothetical protein I79_016253 [Cricetulus griseus]|uniref:Uncharacterized protein n=1 Tax=Cricetulus griseus TaxID=10029 RepID=G3HYW1_CRIGR|nr:hypothetical protein I79_016253 [Cricetulus griseus]